MIIHSHDSQLKARHIDDFVLHSFAGRGSCRPDPERQHVAGLRKDGQHATWRARGT